MWAALSQMLYREKHGGRSSWDSPGSTSHHGSVPSCSLVLRKVLSPPSPGALGPDRHTQAHVKAEAPAPVLPGLLGLLPCGWGGGLGGMRTRTTGRCWAHTGPLGAGCVVELGREHPLLVPVSPGQNEAEPIACGPTTAPGPWPQLLSFLPGALSGHWDGPGSGARAPSSHVSSDWV